MNKFQRLFNYLQNNTSWFGLVILPYYILRFVLASIKECSLWFYRYPMGHYGCTIPSRNEILRRETEIFNEATQTIAGVDLNLEYQLELLDAFSKQEAAFTVARTPADGTRYYSDNLSFHYNDAFILYCMLKQFNPCRIIEIGSGFSSALMMDLKEKDYPDLDLTFIEPYPVTLNNLLREPDRGLYTLINQKLQDVPIELFDQLQPHDILFIDSSHVLKIGSDLSTIMFSILPRLQPGVLIHIHDIHWPFEYPKKMIYEGRVWNEAYVVRSFLQFNAAFEIMFFPSYLQQVHATTVHERLSSYELFSGSSLWLRRKEGQHLQDSR